MVYEKTTRRRFLVAVVSAGGLSLPLIRISTAWAQAIPEQSPQLASTLGRMARLLYPHASVPDSVYAGVVDGIMAEAAADPQMSANLDEAASQLDQARGTDFFQLDETLQLAVMTDLQQQPFFEAIRFQVLARLYSNPEVWKVMNYPGPSVQLGGYLDRGFNDIDWLPEDV
jgi:hypothetical protein